MSNIKLNAIKKIESTFNIEGINFDESDEYFSGIFDDYLEGFVKPAVQRGRFGHQDDDSFYDYDKFKPLLIIVLLFLKEEILRGKSY